MGRVYGFSRVSTSLQDWAIQVDALTRAGVDDRDIFREKVSGVKRDRAELRRVLDLLRADDRLVVYALDRLARSPLHLHQIVEEIEAKGAKLVSLRENIDTGSPMGRFFISVVGSVACLERDLILSRTRAGAALARERGVKFGRPAKITPALARQVALAHQDEGTTVAEACRTFSISRSTYYNALRIGQQEALAA